MKIEKSGEKICLKCHKLISNKVKRVRVSTFNEDGSVNHENFHWVCWIEYYKEAIKKKTKQVAVTAVQGAKTAMSGLLGGTEDVDKFIDNIGKNMEKTFASMPA